MHISGKFTAPPAEAFKLELDGASEEEENNLVKFLKLNL
jgi:hypothetical protein